jgi:hypothetical protein
MTIHIDADELRDLIIDRVRYDDDQGRYRNVGRGGDYGHPTQEDAETVADSVLAELRDRNLIEDAAEPIGYIIARSEQFQTADYAIYALAPATERGA